MCVRRWATSAVPRIISSSGAGTLRNDDTVGPGPAPSIQLRRVGESVYLVSFPEGRDVPAHALDDTGEVVAEDDRKLVFCRREQTAQRDGSVDAVHGGRADAYEQLVRTRLRDPAACGDGPVSALSRAIPARELLSSHPPTESLSPTRATAAGEGRPVLPSSRGKARADARPSNPRNP